MISVTILVKNGERTLSKVLESLRAFPEVLVLDTGSTDKTMGIAKSYPNVILHERPFRGFGPSHNEAAGLASYDWILSLDADEELSPALAAEILSLKLDPDTLYDLPFRNYFNGKWIRWCGWHPERHIRLYNRTKTSFGDALVHEGVERHDLNIHLCRAHVIHTPFGSVADFLTKMERYSTLFAEEHRLKRGSSPLRAYFHGLWSFVKSYLIKRGFLGGYEGLLISCYNAHTTFYKYLKLYEANAPSSTLPPDRPR